eukprot:scaffold24026_cov19-Tisochrysis_lutea.AAC.1
MTRYHCPTNSTNLQHTLGTADSRRDNQTLDGKEERLGIDNTPHISEGKGGSLAQRAMGLIYKKKKRRKHVEIWRDGHGNMHGNMQAW